MSGTVFIAPTARVPHGSMIDPEDAVFWASWQSETELLEDADIVGADAAVEWGRERAERVLIRLGHTDETYFSAGTAAVVEDGRPLPSWPPEGPPPGGWWHLPPVPSVAEIAQVRADVESGSRSIADAARWALSRLEVATDAGASKRVQQELLRIVAAHGGELDLLDPP